MSAATPDPSFIEVQFLVSKLSKESYKERKANYSQTLTGLGKWWGRKPLALVRAVILGLLLPATGDPKRDREVFLKLMTMDEEGLWRRKTKSIPLREIYVQLSAEERAQWFAPECDPERPRFRRGVTKAEKEQLQCRVFESFNYDGKLEYCDRPEQIDGPSEEAWAAINAHLGTNASDLPGLVRELGQLRFGRIPRVGDAFCGGGSVPFEAARLGCEAYGSDLNPVAALLTWGALHIVGGGPKVAEEVRRAQAEVYAAVDRQVTEWGIEHNEDGWRADAFLYCTETLCPECGWRVPMAPSWVIGEKTHTIASLVPDPANRRFEIEIQQGVTKEELAAARKSGTTRDARLHCPNCPTSTPIIALRRDRRGAEGTEYGLRPWENEDLVPRAEDVFQERLYCIRWVETWIDEEGEEQRRRHYRAPIAADLRREARVLELLRERFHEWQTTGYLPSRRIEPGEETTRLMRERGWTYWHHLFTPRQLLVHALIARETWDAVGDEHREGIVGMLLWLAILANRDSKLVRWVSSYGVETTADVYSNQALNTMLTWAARGLTGYRSVFEIDGKTQTTHQGSAVIPADSRQVKEACDIWITDPPYADAVNYHELSEFFLAWYEKHLPRLFPDWYIDSKRALAIRGAGYEFRRGMVDAYRNLAAHMPDNGLQVVMFTHQDASVWADLALILWAAGLRVTAAWTIATETESAFKEGNYVQGTVLMVLRKQVSSDVAFLDEVVQQVEVEVEEQLKSMTELEDQDDPNFSDSDYQLAAYAAALRVLTRYRGIQDIDIAKELARERQRNESSPLETLIADAVHTASNYLIPKGLDRHLWRRLLPAERFYLKGLEVERHGEHRSGVYQEFARGYGVKEYRGLLESGEANRTRLKTPSEFKRADLASAGFGATITRQVLFAVGRVAEMDEVKDGMTWLKTEVPGYWDQRLTAIVPLLDYLGKVDTDHWGRDAAAARLLRGAVENDHV